MPSKKIETINSAIRSYRQCWECETGFLDSSDMIEFFIPSRNHHVIFCQECLIAYGTMSLLSQGYTPSQRKKGKEGKKKENIPDLRMPKKCRVCGAVGDQPHDNLKHDEYESKQLLKSL